MSDPLQSRLWSHDELIQAGFGAGRQDWTADAIFERGEAGVASAVLALAITEESLSNENRQILRALYEALNGDERQGWRLVLKQRRRGRKLTLLERDQLAADDDNTVRLLEWATKSQGKREAAVALLSQVFGMSRASIFAAQKRARKREESSE